MVVLDQNERVVIHTDNPVDSFYNFPLSLLRIIKRAIESDAIEEPQAKDDFIAVLDFMECIMPQYYDFVENEIGIKAQQRKISGTPKPSQIELDSERINFAKRYNGI